MDNYDEIAAILATLREANFRDMATNGQQQRMNVALWVHRRGVPAQHVATLWRYCKAKGRTAEGLFASSFDKPSTLSKRMATAGQWAAQQVAKEHDEVKPAEVNLAPIYSLQSRRRNG